MSIPSQLSNSPEPENGKMAHFVFSPYIGGAEAVMVQILNHLDRFRNKCIVITCDEIQQDFESMNFPVISIGKFSALGKTLNRYPRLPRFSRFLMKTYLNLKGKTLSEIIRKHDIRILHTHLVFDHYIASRLMPAEVKWIATMHGSYRLDLGGDFLFTREDIKDVYIKPDVITSACHYFLNLLSQLDVEIDGRSMIIDNGIDIPLLDKKRVATGKNDTMRMTFLGGERYEKGGDLLIQALNKVVNDEGHTNIHLDVLRHVNPKAKIVRLVKEYGLEDMVSFHGYVGDNEHLDFIAKNNLFVLPSRTEGVANTLMEAIGLGKPVLATEVGGTGEIVTHQLNGYLCEPDPGSIADGITFFLNDLESLKEIGENNLNLRDRFSWIRIVREYENLYQQLL